MNTNLILKIIAFIFFNLPLITSIILIIICGVSFFKNKDFDFNRLKAGFIGILSVIIISVVLKVIPTDTAIDIVGFWFVKIISVIFTLFAIVDTYEGNNNGIKGLGGFMGVMLLFFMIQRILE